MRWRWRDSGRRKRRAKGLLRLVIRLRARAVSGVATGTEGAEVGAVEIGSVVVVVALVAPKLAAHG